MVYKDYYKDLGIASTASAAEIKKAFRNLAKKHHPDKTKGSKSSEAKFKEINEANEVLSDPEKRKKYDQFGADWKSYEQSGARPGGFDWGKYNAGQSEQQHQQQNESSFNDAGVNDLFEMLFGQRTGQRGGGRRSRAVDGNDLEASTVITLEEAYHGTTRLIQLNGQTIKVTVKRGAADGLKMRIPGKGGAGSSGGKNGDLYLTVVIAAHPFFTRFGDDLHCSLPVDLYTAVLGGKTFIKILKGNITVSIAQGTQNGKELRLAGLGMPVYGEKDQFGNLLVTVSVVLPGDLTSQELEHFKSLSALRSGHRP